MLARGSASGLSTKFNSAIQGGAMNQASMRSLSRRRFLVTTGTALGVGGLLAACQAPSPPAAPTTAAPVTTGASPLKGTKLTVIGGNSYVPAQDGQVDALIKQLSQDTGMDAKIERYADAQMDQ